MNPFPERLLREQEAAKLLGVSHYWLQRQRWLGTGPNWVRVGGPHGRAVRYRGSDIEGWIESNVVHRAVTGTAGHG